MEHRVLYLKLVKLTMEALGLATPMPAAVDPAQMLTHIQMARGVPTMVVILSISPASGTEGGVNLVLSLALLFLAPRLLRFVHVVIQGLAQVSLQS